MEADPLVFLIDDNPDDRALVTRQLRKSFPGIQIEEVSNPAALAEALESSRAKLIITDYKLNWTDGIKITQAFKRKSPECAVIMFTGTGSKEVAVEAMKAGLDDYVLKSPKYLSRLAASVKMAIENASVRRARKDAEETYRKLFDGVPVGLFRATPSGTILQVNRTAATMCGFEDVSGLLSKNWLDMLVSPPDRQVIGGILEESGMLRDREVQVRRRDGAIIWCRINAHLIRDAESNALFYEGSVEDVSERRIAAEALMESESRFSKMADSAPVMMWMVDENQNVTYFNRGWLEFRGRKLKEELGDGWKDGIHPDDFEKGFAEYNRVFATKTAASLEFRLKRADGVYRWILGSGAPRYSPEGKFSGFIGSCIDITERKEIEVALERRGKQLEILTQASRQVNSVLEVSVVMRTLVASAMRLVQASAGTAGLMVDGKMLYSEYNSNGVLSPIHLVYPPGVGVPGWIILNKRPYLCKDAEHDPIVSDARESLGIRDFVDVPILSRNGDVIGCFGIHNSLDSRGFTEQDVGLLEGLAASAAVALENAHSIEERREAEEALRESEERFRIMADSSPVIMWVTDAKGDARFVNRTCREFFDIDEAQIVGLKWQKFIHPDDLLDYSDAFRHAVKNREPFQTEVRVKHADGQWRWVATHGVPRFSPTHDFLGHVGISLDITERKVLEALFHQAQKMEAIGRLAGGVAHDFNNLLTVIIGNVDLMELKLHAKDPLREPLALIRSMIDRGAGLTRQLLAFSRRQPQQPRAINLNHIIADMEKMSRRLIGEDIKLVTRLAKDLPNVKADPGQIEQVVMNLIVNARDAMIGGGTLTLETSTAELDEAYCATHPEVAPGTYCTLTVSDTGSGMSAEVIARAFEPFFTTKPVGQGTGLGLSTVHGIVKQSGGYIWLYSELDVGTSLKIYLPAVADELELIPAQPVDTELPKGNETILIVEDEPAIRDMAAAILKMQGYTVIVAESGGDALIEMERNVMSVDLLLSDVIMPRLSGGEMAARLREKFPELKVLYMSGYPDLMINDISAIDPDAPFIQKPFRPADLARKVREVLDARN